MTRKRRGKVDGLLFHHSYAWSLLPDPLSHCHSHLPRAAALGVRPCCGRAGLSGAAAAAASLLPLVNLAGEALPSALLSAFVAVGAVEAVHCQCRAFVACQIPSKRHHHPRSPMQLILAHLQQRRLDARELRQHMEYIRHIWLTRLVLVGDAVDGRLLRCVLRLLAELPGAQESRRVKTPSFCPCPCHGLCRL